MAFEIYLHLAHLVHKRNADDAIHGAQIAVNGVYAGLCVIDIKGYILHHKVAYLQLGHDGKVHSANN